MMEVTTKQWFLIRRTCNLWRWDWKKWGWSAAIQSNGWDTETWHPRLLTESVVMTNTSGWRLVGWTKRICCRASLQIYAGILNVSFVWSSCGRWDLKILKLIYLYPLVSLTFFLAMLVCHSMRSIVRLDGATNTGMHISYYLDLNLLALDEGFQCTKLCHIWVYRIQKLWGFKVLLVT